MYLGQRKCAQCLLKEKEYVTHVNRFMQCTLYYIHIQNIGYSNYLFATQWSEDCTIITCQMSLHNIFIS